MPQEYVVRWQGARIGAGASVFHFHSIGSSAGAAGIATAVKQLFTSTQALFSADITFSFDAEVRELSNSGTLIAAYPVAPPADISGSSNSSYANGTGLMVRHNTGQVVAGRRLLGRTFMVPVVTSCFSTSGDVTSATQTTVNGAFSALRTTVSGSGSNFAVWSKTHAAVGDVLGSETQSRPSTLRTRNDRV
uniref:Uncharacterized protein n=1 Tax=uncultured prokaryote TaxID=198431 RepID=A0A0H5Q5V8_9ZZZZ|nr:hypothetical protein [uncultured prokaryote]